MTPLARLFSEGFRIFFLSACVCAVLAMSAWEIWLAVHALGGMVELPVAVAPFQWHAHEMIFGFASAGLAGFLLTAVPNWTGGKPAANQMILALFLVWLAGRVAMWDGAALPPPFVAVVDLAFLPLLAVPVARQLIAKPKAQQLVVLVALALLWVSNLTFHLEVLGLVTDGIRPGLRAGLLTLCGMIMVIGGRVTPAFTRNAMIAAGRAERHPRNPVWLALVAILPALALPAAVLVGLPDPVLAGLALVAGAAGLARLALWHGLWTRGRPILWTLHLSYALTGLGFLAYGLSALGIGSEIAALHLLGIGSAGGMTLAILSRATLGHTGRPLVAPGPVAAAYALVPAAALCRFAASTWSALYLPASLAAGALWLAAFGLTLAALAPALAGPRPGAPVAPARAMRKVASAD